MTVPNAYQFNAVRSALEIEDPLGPEQTPELDDAGLTKLEEYKSDLIASGRYRPERGEREEIHYTEMPVSYLSVSAGPGEFLDEGGFETVAFPEHLIPAGAEFGVRVGGDSMEPVYKDGQIVWARRCNTLRFGDVGIFFYDGCGYLKAYSERDDGDGGHRPVLVSYNRRYEPISVLPEQEFRIFGRVLD